MPVMTVNVVLMLVMSFYCGSDACYECQYGSDVCATMASDVCYTC